MEGKEGEKSPPKHPHQNSEQNSRWDRINRHHYNNQKDGQALT